MLKEKKMKPVDNAASKMFGNKNKYIFLNCFHKLILKKIILIYF